MTRRKRKMPPHIVLPNGQWRFVKRGSKRRTHHVKTPHAATKRRVSSMGRYRKHPRGSRGGKKIFGLSTRGLVGGLGMLGLIAGVMFKDQIAAARPVDIPMKDKAVAFALGGPAAVVLAFGKDYLAPSMSSGTSAGKLF